MYAPSLLSYKIKIHLIANQEKKQNKTKLELNHMEQKGSISENLKIPSKIVHSY